MDITNLRYMADQIARNLAAGGDEAAIAGTAEHIQLYWEPRMIRALVEGERAGLSRITREAVRRLADQRPGMTS
jgi:formate dehydrogenase subunit delta